MGVSFSPVQLQRPVASNSTDISKGHVSAYPSSQGISANVIGQYQLHSSLLSAHTLLCWSNVAKAPYGGSWN